MERLFGSIPDILETLGGSIGATEAVVFAAWRQRCGELISERTEPLEFFEDRLVIAVIDATWRVHLEDLAPQLVARLNSLLGPGSVKFVECRIDPAAILREPDQARVTKARAVPEAVRVAAQSIADDHLRESFLDAAAAYLAEE